MIVLDSELYRSLYLAYLLHASLNISPNLHTSSKLLYKGAGATRITSGSRQSANTPFFVSVSKTYFPLPATNIETWQPFSFSLRGVRILTAALTSLLFTSSITKIR